MPATRQMVFIAAAVLMGLMTSRALAAAAVQRQRVPDGGIQPQVRVDAGGTVHLIYFKGEPGNGDLFYVRQGPGESGFSSPIRVNSQEGSVVATGTVRGARMAVGREGRVHVAWMGSGTAQPRGPGDNTPMLYARLNDDGGSFEPQRNVLQHGVGLDGGGTVAADQAGNVYVIWHGRGAATGEANRAVYLARSQNDGATFARGNRSRPGRED